jgi:transcriptional regulator with XRE-family HTH domain
MGESFHSRLLRLRKKIGLSQVDMSTSLGISQSNYSKYEMGLVSPGYSFLTKLYSKYSVNIHWLLTGEGSMYLDQGSGSNNKDRVHEDRIRELEQQISALKKNISLLQAECNELSQKNQKLNSQLIKRLEELLSTKDELLRALSSST